MHPRIIQGGMGVAVSGWLLARTVSRSGQLGVVSGTAIDAVFVRRLQLGDLGGHIRRALASFPFPDVADRILGRYFVEGGREPSEPFDLVPRPFLPLTREYLEILAAANFVEVFLAKEGHDGLVGINFLEKVRIPTLPSIYGAMLAGVDYILMGAGIPREIPGALDAFADGRAATIHLPLEGSPDREVVPLTVDPAEVFGRPLPPLRRPWFLAIVSSLVLAKSLNRRATGRVDGFVIERPSAGGHNAPPRGRLELDHRGEPIYGPRDEVELEDFRSLDRPYWLAGACADSAMLREVMASGATGVQIGTAFALCRESGLTDELRDRLLMQVEEGRTDVRADARVSPTGFPFRVAEMRETLSTDETYQRRRRVCDLGYLRSAYRRPDGEVGFRCSSEPVRAYVRKGGDEAETRGRKCLCNALLANVGLGQRRVRGDDEAPLLTAGSDFRLVLRCLREGGGSYSAVRVIRALLESESRELDAAAATG